MSHEAIITVTAGRVVGKTAHDAETLSEMEGGTYRAVFTKPGNRSVSQMGLFHKFCEVIADNFPGNITKDAVVRILKIECGHGEPMKLADGVFVMVARSIAFNAMESAEFSAFMDKAFTAAVEKFGAALSEAARDELDRMSSPMISSSQGARAQPETVALVKSQRVMAGASS